MGDIAVDHPHPGVTAEGEIWLGVGDDALPGCSGDELGGEGWEGGSGGGDGGEQGEVHLVWVDGVWVGIVRFFWDLDNAGAVGSD